MINQRIDRETATTTVTFSLEIDAPISVVGDFNDWDPFSDPLVKTALGLRSASVALPSGCEIRFRYLVDGGRYLNDPDATAIEPNDFGAINSLLVVAS